MLAESLVWWSCGLLFALVDCRGTSLLESWGGLRCVLQSFEKRGDLASVLPSERLKESPGVLSLG